MSYTIFSEMLNTLTQRDVSLLLSRRNYPVAMTIYNRFKYLTVSPSENYAIIFKTLM